MGNFGYISPLLTPTGTWSRWADLLPEAWRYWKGPLKTGEILGQSTLGQLLGWGWRIPKNSSLLWDHQGNVKIWKRLITDFVEKEIIVLGYDANRSFDPPVELKSQSGFPGISDGKALELLLFVLKFRSILRNYEIPPHKAKALIVWEEGNLGLTCARLIARELRFLTLVNPHPRMLERAFDIIISETGVSPDIQVEIPRNYQGAKIIIQCGQLTKYKITIPGRRALRYELFQNYPHLLGLNTVLPIAARNRLGQMPLYPALGEALLRAGHDLKLGFWCGSEIPLERVLKLAGLFKNYGMEIAV